MDTFSFSLFTYYLRRVRLENIQGELDAPLKFKVLLGSCYTNTIYYNNN